MRAKVRNIHPARNADDSALPRALTPRRVAAIVAGDIAGLSRLMDVDAEGTHARVMRIERDLIKPSIAEHGGRLLQATGNGFIAVFASLLEAVRCAIDIQQNRSRQNMPLPADQRIEYRIGINLDDVILEEDDIYGESVNVEYRLESIADPGQVYISGDIYEQIKHKLAFRYELLGGRKVKTIAAPMRVYRVVADGIASSTGRRRRHQTAATLLLCFGLLVIVGGAVWYVLQQPLAKTRSPGASTTAAPQLSHALASRLDAAKEQMSPALASPPDASKKVAQSPRPAAEPATRAPAVEARPAALAAPPAKRAALPKAPAPPPAVREPEMTMLRGGTFMMGSNEDPTEKPIHRVALKPFAISRYPISVREWNACAAAKACAFAAKGNDDAPVTNVSWSDARQFVAWLAATTHKPYRLPSEAEWEYAARGGTQTKYWWGNKFNPSMAACEDCSDVEPEQPVKVGSFKPNPFGLYDMGGSVDQWVADCWHGDYRRAPSDGSPWIERDCVSHVIRSGSWQNDSWYVRPSSRDAYDTDVRYPTHGFRVALSPS